jgi:hypothetical protein
MNVSLFRRATFAALMITALTGCAESVTRDFRVVAVEDAGQNRRNIRVVLDGNTVPGEERLRATAENIRRSGNNGLEVLRVWMFLPGMDSLGAAYATADFRRDKLHQLSVTSLSDGAVARNLEGASQERVTFKFSLAPKLVGNTLTIAGTTDLPDDAVIVYEATMADDPAEMREGRIKVKNGSFKKDVNVKGWKGQIEVWAAFQPTMGGDDPQPAELLERVGQYGEKLSGANVVPAGNLRRIEQTRSVSR